MSVFLNGKEPYKGQVIWLNCSSHDTEETYYAVVFDGKEVKSVQFDSTREPTGNKAEIDASKETMEAYYRYRDAQCLWGRREHLIEAAKGTGLHYTVIAKLYSVYNPHDLDGNSAIKTCLTLLKTKKFRSKFRQSCAEQLREWLTGVDNPHKQPLTMKQLTYL